MKAKRNGLEYATNKMLSAEDAGDYTTAVYWANARDRLIAAYEKQDALREARKRRKREED